MMHLTFCGYMEHNEVMYMGCKFTKLSVIVCLFHINCLNKVTNKVSDMLLDLLRELVQLHEVHAGHRDGER